MKKAKFVCLALLCAIVGAGCSGNHHKEVSAADTIANSNTDTTLKEAKLVKTADMRFKVKNVARVSEDIATLTAKCNGMVMHHNMQASMNRSQDLMLNNDSLMRITSYSTNADMVVKIPSAQVEDFMNLVDKMALFVNTRNMDIQDKSLDYLASQMKLLSRSQIVAQQKTGVIKIKDPAAVMNLKDDLIDEQISNKRIDEAVKFSTIALSFYQSNTVVRESVVNDDPSNFKLSLITQLGQSIANGWVVFADCVIAVANLWVFLLIGIAAWLGYLYWKKRNTHLAAL